MNVPIFGPIVQEKTNFFRQHFYGEMYNSLQMLNGYIVGKNGMECVKCSRRKIGGGFTSCYQIEIKKNKFLKKKVISQTIFITVMKTG